MILDIIDMIVPSCRIEYGDSKVWDSGHPSQCNQGWKDSKGVPIPDCAGKTGSIYEGAVKVDSSQSHPCLQFELPLGNTKDWRHGEILRLEGKVIPSRQDHETVSNSMSTVIQIGANLAGNRI